MEINRIEEKNILDDATSICEILINAKIKAVKFHKDVRISNVA